MEKYGVAILGVFVADLAFRAGKMPAIGETIAGSGFAVGPGGEAEALTGIAVGDFATARRAGDALLARGAGTAPMTLGERGALFHSKDRSVHIAPFSAGKVVETIGAGAALWVALQLPALQERFRLRPRASGRRLREFR
jgi:sugar/nucleoside kinase (ribokinase family)